MTDLEKDKILLLANSIGKMARELQSIKRLLKEMVYVPQTETETETQNSNENSNVILVYDGVSEAVRCAMCSNPNKSDRGCDGACSYDEKLYERIMKAITESIADTPQTDSEIPNNCEPRTERIKTLDYCDICNHKGCDNCIANNLDDYCVPSGYEPTTQTETQNSNLTFEKDECAKEYEELGLKELKELINADRKTEPSCSEKPNNCDTCRNKGFEGCEQPCLGCGCCGLYEPKDEPKICDTCRYYNSNIPCGSTPSACKEADKFAEEFVDGLKKLKPKTEPQTYVINPQEPTNDDKCFECDDFFTCDGQCDEVEDEPQTEPQTDCSWK